MANTQQAQPDQQQNQQQNPQPNPQDAQAAHGQQPERSGDDAIDGLKGKKPEELTPEELRLMADTMPGEGPGD